MIYKVSYCKSLIYKILKVKMFGDNYEQTKI